jgi:hypothetical protein
MRNWRSTTIGERPTASVKRAMNADLPRPAGFEPLKEVIDRVPPFVANISNKAFFGQLRVGRTAA